MADVTGILSQNEFGDPSAASQLLPLLYDELRKLAAMRLAQEKPGHTLDATALVHEAYLRVAGTADPQRWEGRAHFFAAAAQAMRRILVESARRKKRLKHGGDMNRVDLEKIPIDLPNPREDVLALDQALDKLKQVDGTAAELIQLRYFAGLTVQDAADIMDISLRSAERLWTYARAWLHKEIEEAEAGQ